MASWNGGNTSKPMMRLRSMQKCRCDAASCRGPPPHGALEPCSPPHLPTSLNLHGQSDNFALTSSERQAENAPSLSASSKGGWPSVSFTQMSCPKQLTNPRLTPGGSCIPLFLILLLGSLHHSYLALNIRTRAWAGRPARHANKCFQAQTEPGQLPLPHTFKS